MDESALWQICVREHALKLAGRYYISGNFEQWYEFNLELIQWDKMLLDCPHTWKRIVRDFPHLRAFEILFV